jgi:hypothetical protein
VIVGHRLKILLENKVSGWVGKAITVLDKQVNHGGEIIKNLW